MSSPPPAPVGSGKPTRQRLPSSTLLKVRLTLMTLLLVALLTSLSSLLVRNMFASVTPSLRSDLRWKAQRGVVELSFSADFGVLTGNVQQLTEAASEYTRDPDVAFLRFRDGQEQVLFQRGSPSDLPALEQTAEAVMESPTMFLAWAPVVIEGLRVGDVTLAISKQRMQAGTQLYRRMLVLGVLGASAALAVALLFVRRYVTPILRLTEQTSRDLERTAKAALASAEAKSQFLANMSHEIRTPMNGVFGMLHLVQQTRLDGEQKRYLNVISSSARSLLKVVNDILDFSKLNARGYQLAPEPCSPERLVDETLLLLSERAREKGLALSADVEASTPAAVLIDGDRFRQILNNLLGNAIKFTDQGSVQVSVRARATEGPSGQLLEVAVSDTGPGIPEGAQSRLFQAFSQVDESSRRAHEGTGLGLAISKQLIELMGGQIGYRRLEAGGSCFQFTLPVQPCELAQLPAREPAARAAESSSSAGVAATTELGTRQPADSAPAASTSRISAAPAAVSTPASSYAGRPILLVDDNEVNQIVAVEVLEHLGFAVDVAAGGQDAIDAALSKSYALILMDCQMPGMDGYEATREIRRLQQGPHLPIVAFTAHALPEERDKVLRSGMDDILLKPIDPAALAAVLTRHLGSARGSLRPSRRAEPTPLAAPSSATPSSAARPRLSTHAAAPSRPPRPETEVVLVPGLRRPPRAVATFLRQTPAELQSLLGAVQGTGRGAEREELRRIAHKLKGSAGSLGAPELAGLCEELQDTALVAPIAQLAELVQTIERAHQRASAALEQQTSKVSTA